MAGELSMSDFLAQLLSTLVGQKRTAVAVNLRGIYKVRQDGFRGELLRSIPEGINKELVEHLAASCNGGESSQEQGGIQYWHRVSKEGKEGGTFVIQITRVTHRISDDAKEFLILLMTASKGLKLSISSTSHQVWLGSTRYGTVPVVLRSDVNTALDDCLALVESEKANKQPVRLCGKEVEIDRTRAQTYHVRVL